ncbi:hypothetical protein Tco_0242272 [Tanacetum coccineum]
MQNYHNNSTASTSRPGTLQSQTVTNPREQINAITTRSGKTLEGPSTPCEGPSTPLVPTPVVSTPLKEPEQNPETSTDKVQKPSLESTAQVPPPEEEESIFIEIPKPKAKKTVNIEIQEPNSPKPTSFIVKEIKQHPFLEIGLKDALVEMPKFNKWLSSLLRNKEKLEEIAITTVNAECSAIIMNKVPEKLEDPGKFLIPCALQELDRTNPRVPIILGRPFLCTAKALIDLHEETLTLRVRKEELVYYVDKSEKNKDKHFVHAISVIDFLKNDPFSGSTTTHSDDPSPSSSTVKTSDNLEKFTDELTPLNSLPPGDDVSIFKKDSQEGNFQVHSNPLFEFDDNFKSSTINPLFDEMEEDVEIENSNEPGILMDYEEGYYDSGGDVLFLESLLCEDTTHNFFSEVISDHDTSITFSPRSDPLHLEFAGELITLPSRIFREHEEYLNLYCAVVNCSTSPVTENVHANQSLIIESLPVEDSDPAQEEINIFLIPDDLIPSGVENGDSEDEDIELPNLDHQDDPSIPRPPPEPPDIEKCLKPEAGILITKVFKGVSKPHDFMADIPTLVSELTFILFLSSFLSFESEDTIFDPGISTFPFSYLKPVPFALPKDK